MEHEIGPIDLVAVNLYPFKSTLASGGDIDACIENIDIGGPALIRAAAKNHNFVTVVINPADYPLVMAEMEQHDGATTPALRRRMAGLAFSRVAAYDAAISTWLAQIQGELSPTG